MQWRYIVNVLVQFSLVYFSLRGPLCAVAIYSKCTSLVQFSLVYAVLYLVALFSKCTSLVQFSLGSPLFSGVEN